MGDFQSTVNIFNALGIVGDLAFDGPIRAGSYNLNSSGTPNVIGYAYTVTNGINPEPSGAAGNAGTAQVGGTGAFAGILINPKEYPLRGVTGAPLGASIVLPDFAIGDLLIMGEVFVNIPGPASVGDAIAYSQATGALVSYVRNASFTASITTTVLTVTAITAGVLAIGSQLAGAGITPGTYIVSLGTGLGGTGTYNINNSQTVGSEVMSAANLPPTAFTATGSIAATTLTVSAVATGQLHVGDTVTGTGVLPNTVITAYGSGVGGTGTYTVNNTQTVSSTATLAGPTYIQITDASVTRYDTNSTGGVAAIRLTK